jgi:hypothetical protein
MKLPSADMPEFIHPAENFKQPSLNRFYRVLTRVYSIQDYWIFGLFPQSGDFGSRNTTFRKMGLLPSSGERGGEDVYSVGPLERDQ